MSVGGPTKKSLVRAVTKLHTVQNPRLRVDGSCFRSTLPSSFWLNFAISLRPGKEEEEEKDRRGCKNAKLLKVTRGGGGEGGRREWVQTRNG